MSNMKFRFEDYKGDYVMWCKTEEEAKDFCRVMHESGRGWASGNLYINHTNYYSHTNETCYNFNAGEFSSMSYYKRNDYKILKWEDFMENKFTKRDLRTGMLIENRIGALYIVGESVDGDKILAGNPSSGYYWLDDFEDNLLTKLKYCYEDADIMKVYSLSQLNSNNYTLSKDGRSILFERKETVELTLDEIADKFGIRVEDLKIKK